MSSGGDVFDRPKTYTGRWTMQQMDELRHVTDEPADAVIAEFFQGEAVKAVGEAIEPHALLMQLMNDRISGPVISPQHTTAESADDESVPVSKQLLDRLAQRCPLPVVPPEEVREGQELFQNYGPEVLLNLACFSLPMAYGAAKGAMVLHETGYLENRVKRRLIETTQMVVDVMKPDGLKPGGDGLRTAHEIRLMHAAIRFLIKHRDPNWDTEHLGQPINQEDMAGTLMTFSYVVLKGLHKLGIRVERDAQEAYLRAWCYIGRTMGLNEDLLPRDLQEAQQLTWFIYDRQMGGSEQGRKLMKALLDTMSAHLPKIARWFAPSALRVMMEKDLADKLAVPRHPLSDTVTFALLHLYAGVNNLINIDALGFNPHRWFSKLAIEAVTFIGRGHDRRATFMIPEELHEYWKKPPKKKRR